MAKKRKIDFVLNKQDDERLVFRFYPRQSNCHSFGNEPPKSWKEVYKVYYAYSILKQHKWNDDDDWTDTDIVFECGCDECSAIDEVAFVCKEIAKGNYYIIDDRYENKRRIDYLDSPIIPFGMGVDWNIHKLEREDWENEDKINIFYTFNMWNFNNTGFRFTLEDSKMKEFGEYLDYCCEYMLAHGEPI